MNISMSFKPINIRVGAFSFKRGNRSEIHRRIPIYNDPDDYDDVEYYTKAREAPGMSSQKNNQNNRSKRDQFLKIAGIIVAIVVIMLGILRLWLIPRELESYYPVHEKRWIGLLQVQHQQKINSNFLAHFTYVNTDRELQSIDDAQQGNGVILEVAYIELPGFAIPGELSGIKSVGIDIQQFNTTSISDDPTVMSNNTRKLNGGTDSFFNFTQTISIPQVTVTLTTLSIVPTRDFAAHCYNIYATTNPAFALSAEPAPGRCTSPFI